MSVLSNGLIVVIFMIFMLAGKGGPAPPEGGLRAQIDQRIKRYLLTKVVVSGLTGLLVGVTLWVLDVQLAMVFGLLAFLLNFIPNIGSVIATLLPLPVVVLSPDLSMVAKILAIAIPGAVQFSVGNLIEPKIMGESLDLHPVVVLLGLIFFGWLWGDHRDDHRHPHRRRGQDRPGAARRHCSRGPTAGREVRRAAG
jgi:AI-2 transport protein TqsA